MASLTESNLPTDPIAAFSLWYKRAQRTRQILQADAACLSTLSPDGYPAGRFVLLKGFGPEGFIFYTNLRSLKGRSLLRYPKAALTFFWEVLGRQIRLVGKVKPVKMAEANAYFASRPRLSQIGAWASDQSAVLSDRAQLEKFFSEYEKKFQGRPVPRPPYWSGFSLQAKEIEFWQAQPNRLHDRFLYRKTGRAWKRVRLNP